MCDEEAHRSSIPLRTKEPVPVKAEAEDSVKAEAVMFSFSEKQLHTSVPCPIFPMDLLSKTNPCVFLSLSFSFYLSLWALLSQAKYGEGGFLLS